MPIVNTGLKSKQTEAFSKANNHGVRELNSLKSISKDQLDKTLLKMFGVSKIKIVKKLGKMRVKRK